MKPKRESPYVRYARNAMAAAPTVAPAAPVPVFKDPVLAVWEKRISPQTAECLKARGLTATIEPIRVLMFLSAVQWECFDKGVPRVGLSRDVERLCDLLMVERMLHLGRTR